MAMIPYCPSMTGYNSTSSDVITLPQVMHNWPREIIDKFLSIYGTDWSTVDVVCKNDNLFATIALRAIIAIRAIALIVAIAIAQSG